MMTPPPPKLYWSISSPDVSKRIVTPLLDQRGWIRVVEPRNARLIWAYDAKIVPWKELAHDTLINRVMGTSNMTKKTSMAINLRAYENQYRQTKGPIDSILPETFLMPEDCNKFMSNPSYLNEVWIRKEPDLSQGEGAIVLGTPASLGLTTCEKIMSYKRDKSVDTTEPSLLQRYVMNPLLLSGRKSEIRTYWLLASVDPLLVLYHDGTVRLNTIPFKHDDWENPLVHITNTFQQKQALGEEDYNAISDTLKWDLPRLGKDVVERKLTTNTNWVEEELKPMLKRVIIRAVNATKHKFVPMNAEFDNVFELLGMDCMVANDLSRVWMTEIQRGPGLSLDNPVKIRVIPAMLMEIVDLVSEIAALRKRNIVPNRHILNSVHNWEWIMDEGSAEPWYFA